MERVFFFLIGVALLIACGYSVLSSDHAGAATLFAMAFFSFFYSSMSRFRRFKGLGFEAELWEEKQKEAEQLVERMKTVLEITTSEIVMGKVMQGRLADGPGWRTYWDLYDRMVAGNSKISSDINFTDLKREMDQMFAFDLVSKTYERVWRITSAAKNAAQAEISKKFGSPIKDHVGYSEALREWRAIPDNPGPLFDLKNEVNLAAHVLKWAEDTKSLMKKKYDIDVEYEEDDLDRLRTISELVKGGPIVVTDELVEWTMPVKR